MTERMQELGGLSWWRDQVASTEPQRSITVDDVVHLMHDLWRDNRQGPGKVIVASVETVETFTKLVSFYRRRANRRRRKQQKRAIGRHRW